MSRQAEVLKSLEEEVGAVADAVLRDVEDTANWQPTDLVPDPATEAGIEAIHKLREQANSCSISFQSG